LEFCFQLQHVTWNEFLPRVLGWNAINLYELGLETDGFYDGYDEKCNPTIMNEFAAAAFRFGHSLLKPTFAQVNHRNSQIIVSITIFTVTDIE
jgi:peroxidase